MEKNNIKASFTSKNYKGGMFTSLLVVIVIALVVIVNLFVQKLNITKDFTSNNLYSISDETKKFVSGISDTIRIYYFAEEGKQTELVYKVVEKYDGLGKDMKLINVDPVLHPNYASSIYEDAGQVQADTVIIVNETNGRKKLITYSEFIKIEQSIDYSTYQVSQVQYSDVEGQMDSALIYVSTSNVPKIYCTSGHGETALSEVFSNLLSKNIFEIQEIETLTASEIPSDCDILLVNYPQNDFTEQDAEMIKSYLDKGGNAIFNVSNVNTKHKNIVNVLNYYGLKLVEGMIVEADNHYYLSNYPYYIYPQINAHSITEGVKAVKKVLAPSSYGLLETDDIRESLTVTKLLSSSKDSFSKVDEKSNYTTIVEGVDIDGPFALGAYVTDSKTDAKLIVYSSLFIWDDNIIGGDTYGNSTLLVNSFKYLAQVESTFNVPAIQIDTVSTLSISGNVQKIGVILKMIILPFGCLVAGILIFVLRRRSK